MQLSIFAPLKSRGGNLHFRLSPPPRRNVPVCSKDALVCVCGKEPNEFIRPPLLILRRRLAPADECGTFTKVSAAL